jgi:hypothetical protein
MMTENDRCHEFESNNTIKFFIVELITMLVKHIYIP